ncbi:hypothetical protein LTR53_014749 [Teratosphaeriaceae sp. CCFEE 6253]|nr:hypothetical protein LTR53_014749 [Teratosphaeriaceae sp. CCFEE 6253]
MEHTDDAAASPLLGLPAEVRKSIYRFALVETSNATRIHLTRQCTIQPGLLLVNRQVRSETTGIYFSEKLHMTDMDVTPLIHLRRLTDDFRSPKVRNVWYYVHGLKRRANLLRTLKVLHGRPLSVFWVPTPDGSRFDALRQGMELVEEYRGVEWETVELVLKGFVCGLKAAHSAWV